MERRHMDVVVAACRKTLGIGVEGALPWRIPADMKYFRQLTTSTRDPLRRNAVVMGRKTWESLPAKARPLADRLNVLLSRTPEPELREKLSLPPEVLVASSLDAALVLLSMDGRAESVESVFIVGGAAVYAEALASERLDRAYVTFVDLPADAPAPEYDALLPSGCFDKLIRVRATRGPAGPAGASPEFVVFARDATAASALPTSLRPAAAMPSTLVGESGYLELVRDVIARGNRRGDRTGTGTRSLFGAQLRFDLRGDVFPLLTTKAVFWRGVAEELLWFVSGDTSAATLQVSRRMSRPPSASPKPGCAPNPPVLRAPRLADPPVRAPRLAARAALTAPALTFSPLCARRRRASRSGTATARAPSSTASG